MAVERYITISQLSKMLGLSRAAIYRKIKSGQLKASRIGRNLVVSDKDIAGVLGNPLTDEDKKSINQIIKKILHEYGGLLDMLGKK